jgi:hypothetical protein
MNIFDELRSSSNEKILKHFCNKELYVPSDLDFSKMRLGDSF